MVNKNFKWIALGIIGLGILLRLVLLIYNRNLILDEVNVARNLYERNFVDLLKPLNYEQFAPPLFLWIEKLNSLIISNREWALRLFPFLCSIANLLIFYKILVRVKVQYFAFYPLLIFATGMLFLRYATELKQYSSDITVCLSLLLLSLKYETTNTKPIPFFIKWLFVLSIANWLSMPSIFVIASIGIYYFIAFVELKNSKLLIALGLAWMLYLIQFYLYYKLLLQPSIKSDYLQNWHQYYFLNWNNLEVDTLKQNKDLLKRFLEAMIGENRLAVYFNVTLFGLGCFYFAKEKLREFLLLALPLLFLLITVSLHKYTLLPRVCSFAYPLLLLIIAKGLESFFAEGKMKRFIILPVLICLWVVYSFNKVEWAWDPPKFEKTTEGFEWIKSKNANASFVHVFVYPSLLYYAHIHPDSSKWQCLKNATAIDWDRNLDSIYAHSPNRIAIQYTWMDENDLVNQTGIFRKYYSVIDSLQSKDQYVYLLERRKQAVDSL